MQKLDPKSSDDVIIQSSHVAKKGHFDVASLQSAILIFLTLFRVDNVSHICHFSEPFAFILRFSCVLWH